MTALQFIMTALQSIMTALQSHRNTNSVYLFVHEVRAKLPESTQITVRRCPSLQL